MAQKPLNAVIVGGGIGGLFAGERADRSRSPGVGLRAGAGAGRDRRRRVPDAEQRAPTAARGARTGGRAARRAGRRRFALFPPRRRADRAGAGDGLRRLERDVRHAPRRLRRTPGRGRCPQASCIPDTAPSRFEQEGDSARVSFANGATAEGDIVIAADGIHSELRPLRRAAVAAGLPWLGRLPRRAAARARSAIGRPTAG